MKRQLRVLYQSSADGAAWDVTHLVSAASWSTRRAGSPESLKLSVLPSPVEWREGSVLCLRDEEKGYFYGYLFRVGAGEKGEAELTAYTQIRYLKNKDTYVLEGLRADEILRLMAEDFKLETGELANTGYVIPALCEDNQSLLDILNKALDYTLVNTGKMFYLWDDYGKLRLSSVEESKLDLMLGDGSLATGFRYESEIDTDTGNRIKLVRDNADTGRRDVYLFQDSANMARWGILQHFEKVEEKMNAAQIAQRGDLLLELKNRPKRSLALGCIGDLRVRAGCALFVQLEELGIRQYCVVEEATHDLLKKTMDLKVRVA